MDAGQPAPARASAGCCPLVVLPTCAAYLWLTGRMEEPYTPNWSGLFDLTPGVFALRLARSTFALAGVMLLASGLALAACRPAAPSPGAAAGDPARGRTLFEQKGCGGCHVLQGVPSATGAVGPPLTGIASTAANRVPGTSAEQYIRQSIMEPNAYVVPGFAPGLMPAGLASGREVDDLVAFLMTQR